MNSEPLSESIPSSGNGHRLPIGMFVVVPGDRSPGVRMYKLTDKGLALELTGKGTIRIHT